MPKRIDIKMKTTGRSHIAATLTCLSLVISLSVGILISARASAAPNGGGKKASKISTDLKGGKAGDRVKVILQLNEKMSGQLVALLSRNDVHVKATFKNFNAHA